VTDFAIKQRLAAVFSMMLVAACHAQVKGGASVNASGDDERKWEETEHDPAPTTAPHALVAAPAPEAPSAPASTPFIGVTHDLSLTPSSSRQAACRCLAVSYGSPDDPKFAWQAPAPQVGVDMVAIAIAADGVACSSPGYAPLRASISAVDRQGADIIVLVENVREGRPVMHGALAPRPGPGGAIVVRARKGAPYGASVNGASGSCRIAVN
jgi:hypothetical protein